MHAAVLTDTGVVVDAYIEHRVDRAGRDLCHRSRTTRGDGGVRSGGSGSHGCVHAPLRLLRDGSGGAAAAAAQLTSTSTTTTSSSSSNSSTDSYCGGMSTSDVLATSPRHVRASPHLHKRNDDDSSSTSSSSYDDDDSSSSSSSSAVAAASADALRMCDVEGDDGRGGGGSGDCYYACRAVHRPLPQRIFHETNVLPFGLRSASSLFATPGRHTNHGLVLGVDAHGRYLVLPYTTATPTTTTTATTATTTTTTTAATTTPLCVKAAVRPWRHSSQARATSQQQQQQQQTQLSSSSRAAAAAMSASELLPTYHVADVAEVRRIAQHSASAAVLRDMHSFFARCRRLAARVRGAEGDDATCTHANTNNDNEDNKADEKDMAGVRVCALHELQLPPALAVHAPVPPLRVGAYVLARRYGCATTLHLARVAAVHYDVSYTLQYLSDGGVDVAVLHNDVHLLTSTYGDDKMDATRSRKYATAAAAAATVDDMLHRRRRHDAADSSRHTATHSNDNVNSDGEVDYSDCLVPQYKDAHSPRRRHGQQQQQQGELRTRYARDGDTMTTTAAAADVAVEVCTVRDRVVVALHKQLPALVVEALGEGHYRVVLDADPLHDVHVTAQQVLHVLPVLREAVYADPRLVATFARLDAGGCGVVRWKDVRHVLLHMEGYGSALGFQRVGELYRSLRLRTGAVHTQLLRKVPMQDDEMLLSFAEYEYVMLRAQNLL